MNDAVFQMIMGVLTGFVIVAHSFQLRAIDRRVNALEDATAGEAELDSAAIRDAEDQLATGRLLAFRRECAAIEQETMQKASDLRIREMDHEAYINMKSNGRSAHPEDCAQQANTPTA